MNPKKPRIPKGVPHVQDIKEELEQTSFELLKSHALEAPLALEQLADLAKELTDAAPLAFEQKWPENVQKVMHAAILGIADQMLQSIAIIKHVADVINETPVPKGDGEVPK